MADIAKIMGLDIAAGGGDTMEFFKPATATDGGTPNTLYGDYAVVILNAVSEKAFTSFYVPNDFTAITSAGVAVIPRATAGAADWDIYSDFAAAGEAYNTHGLSDVASTYNVVDGQLYEIDISGILTGLAAGDYVGIRFEQRNTNVNVLGVRFRYS